VTATQLRPPASKTALLAVVCLAQFMVILDVAIVNVALPSMRDDLQFSTTGLQWVVNAYTLTFAGFLMLGGRAADLLGRRRVFLAGTALFALSSLACALADSRGLLIGARALQGSGARSSLPPRSRSSRARSRRARSATAAWACGARWARSAPRPARCSAAS
jgi:MFS family permease